MKKWLLLLSGSLLIGCGEPRSRAALVELPALEPRLASLFNETCGRCHSRDLAGTPRAGRPADWQVRASKGLDLLTRNALQGYRGMPPRGLCQDCTEDDLRALVAYMTTGVDFSAAP